MPTKWFGLKEARKRERETKRSGSGFEIVAMRPFCKTSFVQHSVTKNLYSFEGNREPHKPISFEHWVSMIGAASSPNLFELQFAQWRLKVLENRTIIGKALLSKNLCLY